MELDQLRSFVAVAEVRSFTRAARLVHLSQPAISRQIGRLEAEMGTALFERYGRHVECTADGRLLLPLAKNIVARADDAARLIREHVGTLSAKVRFGSTGTVFAHLLSPILASFLDSYPKVHLELVEREDVLLEEAVISGELDCAVVTAWGTPRAATVHLLTEEILLVVRSDHPLAGREEVSLSSCAHEPFLLPGLSMNIANMLTDLCRQAGFEPRVPYRANYLELSKALVRQGMGIALIPKMLLSPHTLEGLVALHLEGRPVRALNLVFPRERPMSTAARTLMIHIRASVSEHSGADLN
jgi:LysR family transcriptional activator of glutamate synthase operon